MSYTYDGQLSTDKDDRKLQHISGHILIIPFPGNGTMKKYTSCRINLLVEGHATPNWLGVLCPSSLEVSYQLTN